MSMMYLLNRFLSVREAPPAADVTVNRTPMNWLGGDDPARGPGTADVMPGAADPRPFIGQPGIRSRRR